MIFGLNESEHLIVIVSKNSANFTWVMEEIIYWHKLNKDKKIKIITSNSIKARYLGDDDSHKTLTELIGYFGVMVPPVSVKPCQLRSIRNIPLSARGIHHPDKTRAS